MAYDPAAKRPAIVTDESRQWAIDQKPIDWDERAPDLAWEDHVAEQAERFERHFGDDRKPHAEWAGLWRRAWWPKADPSILHPKKAPHVPHPFVRRGDELWQTAIGVLDAAELRVAQRFGIVQFRPDDPRVAVLAGGSDAR